MKASKLVLVFLALMLCIGTASASYKVSGYNLIFYEVQGKTTATLELNSIFDTIPSGQYVYAATHTGIVVIDAKDVYHPKIITTLPVYNVQDMIVKFPWIYAGGRKLTIINIQDRAKPYVYKTKNPSHNIAKLEFAGTSKIPLLRATDVYGGKQTWYINQLHFQQAF